MIVVTDRSADVHGRILSTSAGGDSITVDNTNAGALRLATEDTVCDEISDWFGHEQPPHMDLPVVAALVASMKQDD